MRAQSALHLRPIATRSAERSTLPTAGAPYRMDARHLADLLKAVDEFVAGARFLASKINSTTQFRGVLGEVVTIQKLLTTYREEFLDRQSDLEFRGGSKPGNDIQLTLRGRRIGVECKTKSQKNWVRMNASKFIDVRTDLLSKEQHLGGILPPEPNVFWVFVDLSRFAYGERPEFYVL